MLTTAKMESNFNPKASATTSSARGLYQFIDQTWLGTVKEAGSQLGYGKYADAISKSSSGTYYINDPSMRTSVMKLRDDPDAASSMAAVLTQSNSFKLTGKIGRRPTDSELYMAHFMGVGGAGKLISNAEDNPNASAARLFPNAAAANRSIFYEKGTGRARSVSEVYSVLTTRYASAANAKDTRTAFAALGGAPRPTAVASVTAPPAASTATMANANFISNIPDARTVTPVTATTGTELKTASLPQQEPMFRTLFQAGDRPQPISPAVQELWGGASLRPARRRSPIACPKSAHPAGSTSSAIATARSRASTFARLLDPHGEEAQRAVSGRCERIAGRTMNARALRPSFETPCCARLLRMRTKDPGGPGP